MKVVLVGREKSDYNRAVETFIGDFRRQTGKDIEVIDPDTRDGDTFCRAYGVVEYPTVLALSDEGAAIQTWRGAILPTISEVSYYAG